LPNDPYTYAEAADWRTEHKIYLSKLPDSKKAIDAELKKGEYGSPRMREWKHFTEDLKTGKLSKLDTKTKVELVNAWCNRAIAYDDDKAAASNSLSRQEVKNWYQTPDKTLRTGKGTCADIARLKAATLAEAGVVPEQDERLILAHVVDTDGKLSGHEFLMVNVDGNNYILNNNMNQPLPKTGGLETDREHLGPNSQYCGEEGVYPVSAERTNGRVTYYDPQKIDEAVARERKSPTTVPERRSGITTNDESIHFDTQKGVSTGQATAIRKTMDRANALNPVTGDPSVYEKKVEPLTPPPEPGAEKATHMPIKNRRHMQQPHV
jgi:predicted transglutaminase-like cysteine proteinase